MKLHILGVNGPFPAPGEATSGYLLETADGLFQLDFGSGILSRLTALSAPEDLTALFLSHWHYDHTSDLLPLIYRLEAVGCVLPVYAPADGDSPLRRLIAASSCMKLTDLSAEDVLSFGSTEVTVLPARHPVPAVGFRFSSGHRVFGYTGDTNTLPSLADDFRGCDLLLADGLFPQASWNESKPHLSACLAAQLARDAGADRLVITHFNPAFSRELLLSEARTVFSCTSAAVPGSVLSV